MSRIQQMVDRFNQEFYGVKAYYDTLDDEGVQPVIELSLELIILRKSDLGGVLTAGYPLLASAARKVTDVLFENAKVVDTVV